LSARCALGRIGETPEQCTSRYGESIKTGEDKSMIFKKSGLLIMVDFYDGKADMINFSKAQRNILGKAEKLSENEIQTLLKSNGADRTWKKRDILSMNEEWETEDGVLLAHLESLENFLIVTTKDHMTRAEAKKKQKEDKNLGGF
ncbi:MAG: hypothetical protein WCP22_13925, partial [Chlamydiota bacterium]